MNEIHDTIDSLIQINPGAVVHAAVRYQQPPSQLALQHISTAANADWATIVEAIPAIVMKAKAADLAILPALPGVVAVDYLPPGSPSLATAVRAVKIAASNEYFSSNVEAAYGYRGEGILVAVIDSGIDDFHESLMGSVLTGAAVVQGKLSICINGIDNDADGKHGTGVAGSLAASDEKILSPPSPEREGENVLTYRGAAPKVQILEISMEANNATAADAVLAFNMTVMWNKPGNFRCGYLPKINVLNFPWNFSGDDCGQGTLGDIMLKAVDEGIVVVNSVGNIGPQPATVSSPNTDPPIIHVAAVQEIGENDVSRVNDVLYAESARGPRCSDGDADAVDELVPTLAAPGAAVIVPISQEGQVPCANCYATVSGTSQASPIVAGTIALMLEARPCLQPVNREDFRLYDVLLNSTEYRTEAAPPPQMVAVGRGGLPWNNAWGYGYLDAFEAVTHALQAPC